MVARLQLRSGTTRVGETKVPVDTRPCTAPDAPTMMCERQCEEVIDLNRFALARSGTPVSLDAQYTQPCVPDELTLEETEKLSWIVRRAVLIAFERRGKSVKGSKEAYCEMDSDRQDAVYFSVPLDSHSNLGLAELCAYTEVGPISLDAAAEMMILGMADKITIFPVGNEMGIIPIMALDDPCYIAFIVRYILTGIYTLTELRLVSNTAGVRHGLMLFHKAKQVGYKIPSVFLVPSLPVETRDFYRMHDFSVSALHPVYQSKTSYQSGQRYNAVDDFCNQAVTTAENYSLFVEHNTSIRIVAFHEGIRICFN